MYVFLLEHNDVTKKKFKLQWVDTDKQIEPFPYHQAELKKSVATLLMYR